MRPWSAAPSGVHYTLLDVFPCQSVFAAIFSSCISDLHQSAISSIHSLYSLPLLLIPSVMPNTNAFSFPLSSILQMRPNSCRQKLRRKSRLMRTGRVEVWMKPAHQPSRSAKISRDETGDIWFDLRQVSAECWCEVIKSGLMYESLLVANRNRIAMKESMLYDSELSLCSYNLYR